MPNIQYFKTLSKNLLKNIRNDEWVNFPVDFRSILDSTEIKDCTLMKAQHIVSKLMGFSSWSDLINSSSIELEKRKRLFEETVSNSFEESTTINADEYLLLEGKMREKAIDDQRKAGLGFSDDTMVECLHCGKHFLFKDVKVIKTKDEYKQSELDELEMIMCPNYPECNGDLMDFIPVEE